MMTFFLLFIIFCGICGLYAWREIGQAPTETELNSYEHLPYFKDGMFQSPEPQIVDMNHVRNGNHSSFSFLRFLMRSKFAPAYHLPQEPLDRDSFPKTPSQFSFYWLGHSTVILELDGKRILFDPVFDNAAPLPFFVPRYDDTPLARKNLPPIDLVIITHNHYDHLERKTVQALKESQFVVPLGVGTALRGWGIDPTHITELGWGEVAEGDGLTITAETASHFSGRQFSDRNKTLWNSYVIQSHDKKIFWAGDTGYSSHFAAIGEKYGPFDLAVIEIDGWNTGWKNTHLFPEQVVQVMTDLKTVNLLPIHWGVFDLALHPWHESIDMLYEAAKGYPIHIIAPIMGMRTDLDSETKPWWRNNS